MILSVIKDKLFGWLTVKESERVYPEVGKVEKPKPVRTRRVNPDVNWPFPSERPQEKAAQPVKAQPKKTKAKPAATKPVPVKAKPAKVQNKKKPTKAPVITAAVKKPASTKKPVTKSASKAKVK